MCKQRTPFQRFVSWFQKNEHPKTSNSGAKIYSPPNHGRFIGPNQTNLIDCTKLNTQIIIVPNSYYREIDVVAKKTVGDSVKAVYSQDWLEEPKDFFDTKIQDLINFDELEIVISKGLKLENYHDDTFIKPDDEKSPYCLLNGYIVAEYHGFEFTLFEPSEWTQDKDMSKCPDVTILFKGELLYSYNKYKNSRFSSKLKTLFNFK